MIENIFAYTPAGGSYPGYVSINREPNGDVSVTVRSAPTFRSGVFVCSFARDRGQAGRCTPGDDRCNNYCNMAPAKGPMQSHPLPCDHVDAGATASFTIPAAAWAAAFPGRDLKTCSVAAAGGGAQHMEIIMFKGYKTYITAAVAVIGAVAAYLVGDATLIQTAQMVVTAILGATIRHGIGEAA